MLSKCCIKQIIKAQSLPLRSSQSMGETGTRTGNSTEGDACCNRGQVCSTGTLMHPGVGAREGFPDEVMDSTPTSFVMIMKKRMNLNTKLLFSFKSQRNSLKWVLAQGFTCISLFSHVFFQDIYFLLSTIYVPGTVLHSSPIVSHLIFTNNPKCFQSRCTHPSPVSVNNYKTGKN